MKRYFVLLIAIILLFAACAQKVAPEVSVPESKEEVSSSVEESEEIPLEEDVPPGFEEAEYLASETKGMKEIANARFNFWLTIPEEWRAMDISATGDGYDIHTDNEKVIITVWGTHNGEEFEEMFIQTQKEGGGIVSSYTFDSGVEGTKVEMKDKNVLYSYITAEGDKISFNVDYFEQEDWFEENKETIETVAKSLRQGTRS